MAVCLVWLAGCSSMPPIGDSAATPPTDSYAATPAEAAADPPAEAPAGTAPGLVGSDANDDLSLGKKHFRAANYGLAEQHFRKAVEAHPIVILGPTPEILNNQGFSYMLRGDYARARQTLRKAQARDPNNPYILNNLRLLDKAAGKGKGLQ
jgi:Flp pilus assembly protein TadD